MGIIRFILAFYVVQFHANSKIHVFGHLPSIDGREAVQIFYLISGFYMSLILNRKYTGDGSVRIFYSNRFLRLWPPYLVVSLIIAVWFVIAGEVRLFGLWTSLDHFWEKLVNLDFGALIYVAFSNIFIVGQDLLWFVRFNDVGGVEYAPFLVSKFHNGSAFLLNHPTFTVAIEALFYLVSPFLLRKSFRWAAALFLLGAGYHLLIWRIGFYHVAYSYHLFLSAGYFFFLGACSYHLYSFINTIKKSPRYGEYMWKIEVCACIPALILGGLAWAYAPNRVVYLALIFAIIMPFLFLRTKNLKFDRMIGQFSYSTYLTHYPILIFLAPFVSKESLGTATALFTLIAAITLFLLVENPIDRWRQQRAQRANVMSG